MSYLKHVLQPDEQVRYVTNIHWVVYLPGALALVLAIIVGGVSLGAQTTMAPLWQILGAMLLVVALLMLLTAWFRRWTTEIAVTNRRIIWKTGFIRRQTREMNNDKVASVNVTQSLFGRVLNYGTVTVQAAGMTLEDLVMIQSPFEFRNHITAG